MELFERESYLTHLEHAYQNASDGCGRAVFLMGEAGVGKTSLIHHFLATLPPDTVTLVGTCDFLFTPRPFAPLYDIAATLDKALLQLLLDGNDRSRIFSTFISALERARHPFVIVFEDVHWADGATIDLMKFLSRRIGRMRCLFVATFRDDEITPRHPLNTIFGELPRDHYTKIQLTRLSRSLVDKLAAQHRLPGDQLYSLTAGNPFYVMEILSSLEVRGVPERVKDSILARFQSRPEKTQRLWELLSILPSSRLEPFIEKYIYAHYDHAMDECVACGIVISRPGHLSFNHELFRRTIEENLPVSRRKELNKLVFSLYQAQPDADNFLASMVHHALQASEWEWVAELAPRAATQAEKSGAHLEAARLYSAAIDTTRNNGKGLAILYEKHAYECYLTHQLPAAMASQQQALAIWRESGDKLREGNALRFLSRLWWFAGDRRQSVAFAEQSIQVLEFLAGSSLEKGWAYSNYSQLAMLAENDEASMQWGQRAYQIAEELTDEELMAHSLINIATTQLRREGSEHEGISNMEKSLSISLTHNFQEHAARAYLNTTYSWTVCKRFDDASRYAEKGIQYCEERDMDSFLSYLRATQASIAVEVGEWIEAERVLSDLLAKPHQRLARIMAHIHLAKIHLRRGKFEQARTLLDEVRFDVLAIQEPQRVIPLLCVELELAWLTGQATPDDDIRSALQFLFSNTQVNWYYSDLAFWLIRVGQTDILPERLPSRSPVLEECAGNIDRAASLWAELGCNYQQALVLMNGNADNQAYALRMLDKLGATATANAFRIRLKMDGQRKSFRGFRDSTLRNPAQLTDRQVDILRLLHAGLQNKEIADRLFISAKTVDHHISAILAKLNVNSRAKAVVAGQKIGVLKN